MLAMFINSLVGEILSQCKHISNYYIVHIKHLTILFVNYTSIKLEKKDVVRDQPRQEWQWDRAGPGGPVVDGGSRAAA